MWARRQRLGPRANRSHTEVGGGPRAPPEAGEGKEMESPLQPPEGTSPAPPDAGPTRLMLAFCPRHPWEERCLQPLLPGSLLQRSRKSHPAPGVLMLRHPERLQARAPPPPNLRLSSRGLFCGAETGASA